MTWTWNPRRLGQGAARMEPERYLPSRPPLFTLPDDWSRREGRDGRSRHKLPLRLNWAESAPPRVASGRTGVRAIAGDPLRARNRLQREKRKTLPRIEAAFARIATAHSSGIPALRRPACSKFTEEPSRASSLRHALASEPASNP